MKYQQSNTDVFNQLKADSVSLSQDWLNNCDEPTLRHLFADYRVTVEQQNNMIAAAGGIEKLAETLANEANRS